MINVVGQPAPRVLTTLATVRGEVRKAADLSDSTIIRRISVASSAIANHCGRQFQREALLQTVRPPVEGPVFLLRYPVRGAITATMDGTAIEASGLEFDAASGMLYRTGYRQRCGWGGSLLAVAYTAGWVLPSFDAAAIAAAGPDELLPAEIEEACLLTISAMLYGAARDPLLRSDTTQDLGGSSWVATADMDALPPQAVSLLESFRAVRGG